MAALATAFVVGVLAGCAGTGAAGGGGGGPETVDIRYQGSANTVSLVELADDLGYLGPLKLDWVGNTTSGPQDIQSAATGQTDIGGAFTGAVAKLIESGAPVKAVVNYYGEDDKTFMGYYVTADSPIRSARDLIGKKVGVNTAGAHAEAVLDTWLAKNGLTPDEIKQVELVVVPPVNTEDTLRRGQIDVAALNGVLQDHAVAAGGLRSLFSDYELFGAFNAGQYVVRNDFAAKNPQTTRVLVSGIAKAIDWERTTPRDQVIARFTKIIEARGRNESTSTLQYWKSVGVASTGGVISDKDFEIWKPWLTQTGVISGDLGVSKLYTNEFNDERDAAAPAAPAKTATG
jgi:ABC-type nitrate/sulfonate/bicarbonate transport system substrate-binding protein